MIRIPLTNGGHAIVDDDVAPLLTGRRWGKYRLNRHKTWYVKQTNPTALERKRGVYLHRLIAGAPDGLPVDHINGDGLDNRRENLRVITTSQNLQNRNGLNRDNKTGIRGVCWDTTRQKYKATVGLGGKTINLGRFDRLEEAAQVVRNARLTLLPYARD